MIDTNDDWQELSGLLRDAFRTMALRTDETRYRALMIRLARTVGLGVYADMTRSLGIDVYHKLIKS
jgi:hypothetical protein